MTRIRNSPNTTHPANAGLNTTPVQPQPQTPSVENSDQPQQNDDFQVGSSGHQRASGEGLAEASTNVVAAVAASQAEGRDALQNQLQSLQTRIKLAVEVLPEAVEAATQNALTKSTERILSSLDQGRITLKEAHRAAHMISEMVGALIAIEQGNCTISKYDDNNTPGFFAYDIHTTEDDLIRVAMRDEGSAQGQARVKLYNVEDNGQPLAASHRMMVRYDLEGSTQPEGEVHTAIDVQLGNERTQGQLRLNKRIHGVLLDETGQPVLNRGGRQVADNHFSQDIPDALNDRENFKTFVHDFLDKVIGDQGETA